jgi:hypothetical protein
MKSKRKSSSTSEPSLSDAEMLRIMEAAWKKYEGDLTVIESAFGALVIGRLLGWQALRIVHPSAYKTYEGVLGIRFRDVMPDRGPDAACFKGYELVDAIGRFWGVVAGGLVPSRDAAVKVSPA